MESNVGAYVVTWDFSHGEEKDILLVGKKVKGVANIINAFQGEEARALYEKLTTVKKGE